MLRPGRQVTCQNPRLRPSSKLPHTERGPIVFVQRVVHILVQNVADIELSKVPPGIQCFRVGFFYDQGHACSDRLQGSHSTPIVLAGVSTPGHFSV